MLDKIGGMRAALSDLTSALERDELVPCFQPIVELKTEKLAGFEILARWQHPGQGLILPHNFIELAEQHGLIGRLMEQVLAKAFLVKPLLAEPLALAVNVSPLQLRDAGLPDQIAGLASRADFSLKRLHVEITETALVDNIEMAQHIACGLKARGCKLAMDDFGTGYSSLRHLQVLPFDRLKVDRSFVAEMDETRESRKIVASIIGLGYSLGLLSVAEGVETEQQANMLRLLGCDMGQGWLYGKPVPADSIPAVLASARSKISSRLTGPRIGDGVSGLEALPAMRLAQLQAIYDGSLLGLSFLDCNLRYISINRRMAQLNGTSVAAHLGRGIDEIVPAVYRRLAPYLSQALEGRAISAVEVCEDLGPNTQRVSPRVLYSCQPAFDEVGEVIGISLSALETTQWKQVCLQRDVQSGSCSCTTQLSFGSQQPWLSCEELTAHSHR